MNQKTLTLEAMIKEIDAIQPVLHFGRGRLDEFKEVLEAMDVDLFTINTHILWKKILDSLIALKGNLSATQAVVHAWQEKIRTFRAYLNELIQGIILPEGICVQDILRARNGLAELTSEILRQRERLSVQVHRLEEQMQQLEKQRRSIQTRLRPVRAPRLKEYMYSSGDELLQASVS